MSGWLARAGLVALGGAMGVSGVISPAHAADASAVGSAVGSVTGAAARDEGVLSGKRQVTIVRVGAFEAGLSLIDGGRLAEVDDDRGRQLFVPTPLGGQQFLIKAYYGAGGGPGTGEPACWRAHNPGNAQPLRVVGASCDAADPRQRFEIIAAPTGGARTYLISNAWAYLRNSSRGLILEELGDAPPTSSFRFNDNGPAPRS
jgi:hypothetical protein